MRFSSIFNAAITKAESFLVVRLLQITCKYKYDSYFDIDIIANIVIIVNISSNHQAFNMVRVQQRVTFSDFTAQQ